MTGTPRALPGVPLAPLPELATAARACRLMREVQQLATWTGRRRITKAGHLLLGDAQRAVVDLRLPGDQGPGRARARNAREFPELDALWRLAVEAELLLSGGGDSYPGPALRALIDDGDQEVVEVWADLLDVQLSDAFWSSPLYSELIPVLVRLYAAPADVAFSDLATEDAQPALRELLQRLVELDAATLTDDDVRLTALGAFGLHRWFETVDLTAPDDAVPEVVIDLAQAGGTAASTGRSSASTYQLKITLADVKPPVWRRLQVPAATTLDRLHAVVQIAMGWTDSHLHEFQVDEARYGVPDADWDDGEVTDEASATLVDLVGEGDRLDYTYDFGDNWRHRIVVERVAAKEPDVVLPRCVAGARACPPEDVGGPWAYQDFLQAYADPRHPDHEQMREWAGDELSPDAFDTEEVTWQLTGRE